MTENTHLLLKKNSTCIVQNGKHFLSYSRKAEEIWKAKALVKTRVLNLRRTLYISSFHLLRVSANKVTSYGNKNQKSRILNDQYYTDIAEYECIYIHVY